MGQIRKPRKPDWTSRLKEGDVIRSKSGSLRVVRSVSRVTTYYGVRTSIALAIQRCSWTGRCYTVISSHDLRSQGYRPTRAKVTLRKKIDKAIASEISRGADPPTMCCCDVKGVS